MIDAVKIGTRIRSLRKQHHISQEKMAEDLNMYQADISNLERAISGSGITDLVKLDMIADYFHIPLTELLTGMKPEENTEQNKDMQRTVPSAEEDDLYAVDYSDLSVVYRYRLMIETYLKYPHIYDEIDDNQKRERAILRKLKAACISEEAYKVWKKDLIDVKAKEIAEKEHLIVCHYVFIGAGDYDEILPEGMLKSFKCWIAHNGSAIFSGYRDANKREIRTYVAKHIADDLLKG